MRVYNKLSIASVSMLTFVVIGTSLFVVAAENSRVNAQTSTQATKERLAEAGSSQAGSNESTNRSSQASKRLTDAKLKACQKHKAAITKKMDRIADRGQKQVNLFRSTATKTETFYVNKGKILSNYEALVTDVKAKQATAQAAVNAVKSSSTSFTCDGTDPKGVAASFKDSLKREITALKDFKTAVKKLVVGVKSVQGTTTSTEGKATQRRR